MIYVDPQALEARHAAPTPEDDDHPGRRARRRSGVPTRIAPLLARIPAPEAEIVRLYFVAHKKQREIASIYGVSQAAISYRLHRALRRLRFVAALPKVDLEVMRGELAALTTEVDAGIVVEMARSTCETAAAEALGLSPGLVRHRFARMVQVLTETASEGTRLARYRDLVAAIARHGRLLLRECRNRKFVYPDAA